MNDIKLSPLQGLYNNASKLMDSHENNLRELAKSITSRIFELIDDPDSYKLGHDAKAISTFIKAFLAFVYGKEADCIDNHYVLVDVVQYLILDQQKHDRAKEQYPEFANRLCWLQLEDMQMKHSQEIELNSLLILLNEVAEGTETEYLYRTYQSNPSLPSRNGIGTVKRSEFGAGLSESDRQKVA